MRKLLTLLFLLSIVPLVSAEGLDVHGRTLSNSAASAACAGTSFNLTQQLNITGVQRYATDTAGNWFLYGGTVTPGSAGKCPTSAILAQGSWGTGVLQANISGGLLLGVGNYTFLTNSSNGNYNMKYGASSDLPVTGNSTFIKYWRGISDTSPIDNYIRNIGGLYYLIPSTPPNATTITVSLTNLINGTSWPNTVIFYNKTGTLNFSIFNITGIGFCVTMTGNGTNTTCTPSSGASIFFNVTNDSVVVSGTTSVSTATFSGLLSLNASRLYLNTSISTFNTTNWVYNNQTTSGTLLLPALNGSNNVQTNVLGNYSMNTTCTAPLLSTATCSVNGVYDAIITVNATNLSNTVTNFDTGIQNVSLGVNFTNVTSGPGIVWPVLQGYTYYLNFSKLDLSSANTTITMTNNSVKYSFSVFPAPAVNLSFYDEINDSQITENLSLEVINSATSYNLTVTNGNRYINLTGVYGWTILRYYNYEYAQRDYLLNLQPGAIYTLRLYDIILNDSQVVTATVYDTGNAFIQNATVSLLRYFVGCNCYRTVQMTSTGADGSGIFYVQALDGHYKWSVSYLDTVYYLSTTSEQINTDTRTFVIDLGQNFYTGFESLTTLGYTVTYNTTTNTLSYTFSDTSGIVSGGCLKVTYLSGVEYTTLQTSCTGGTSGGVLITLPSPNTTTYLYTASVNTTNTYTPLLTVDTGSVQAPSQYDFGNTGIFLAIGVLVVLVSIFSFSAVATILVTALGVIIISLLGIMTFTTTFVIGLCVLVLGISLFLMRS